MPPLAWTKVSDSGLGRNLRICISNELPGGANVVDVRTSELRLFKIYHLNKFRAPPANENGRDRVGWKPAMAAAHALYRTQGFCLNTGQGTCKWGD